MTVPIGQPMPDPPCPPGQTWQNLPLMDQPLLGDLVERHSVVMYRYAVRLSGSTTDAEDLVQQAFVLAQQNLGQLRDPSAAKAWLLALVRSAFGRLVRQPRPIPGSVLELSLDELTLPENAPPEYFDPEALQIALAELPDEYRAVLLGFYFEECSYKELAERLAIPLGTVMSRLARAKVWLRKRLGGDDVNGVALNLTNPKLSGKSQNCSTEDNGHKSVNSLSSQRDDTR